MVELESSRCRCTWFTSRFADKQQSLLLFEVKVSISRLMWQHSSTMPHAPCKVRSRRLCFFQLTRFE